MKQILILIGTFLCLQTSAQTKKPVVNEYAAIDKMALLIPETQTSSTEGIAKYITENFTTDADRTRAIFIWIASSLQYDLANMFALNFHEKKEDKIARALQTRKGICENYAILFTDICTKVGIWSYVIEGYTKQNGFTDYVPHAWSAALVDKSWFLFDPTWGSGYVNGNKFYKKINNEYYKAGPSKLIKSHMPFDYLWQFLNYPVTTQEFNDGKVQENKSKPYFSYVDSLEAYEKLSQPDQWAATARRIEENGVKSSQAFDRLQYLKVQIENNRQNTMVMTYNNATALFNEGVNEFNEFINYRNKQFTPMKPDAEIQAMVDVPAEKFERAKSQLRSIHNPDVSTANLMVQVIKSIDAAITSADEQNEWLKKYFSKGKSARRNMFFERKVSVFGVPIN